MLFHFFSHLDMRIPCGILCAGFWDLQQIKAKTIIGQSFEMKNQIDQRIKVETKYESQNGTAIIQIFTKSVERIIVKAKKLSNSLNPPAPPKNEPNCGSL